MVVLYVIGGLLLAGVIAVTVLVLKSRRDESLKWATRR